MCLQLFNPAYMISSNNILGSSDISLMTSQIISLRNRLLADIKFILNADEVAQESDEIFSISLSIDPGLFSDNATFFRRMNGTIGDSNRKW